jgi:hypothetical protein
VDDTFYALLFLMISISWFVILIKAHLLLPVKLIKVDDQTLTIEIRNTAYAKEFINLNNGITLNDKN